MIVGFLAVPHSSPSPATLIFLINLQSPAFFPAYCTDSSLSTSNNTASDPLMYTSCQRGVSRGAAGASSNQNVSQGLRQSRYAR